MGSILTLLTTVLLFLHPNPTTAFSDCTSVPYSTFYSSLPSDTNPVFGPKGLYNVAPGKSCTLLDVTAAGFASAHPELYDLYVSTLDKITVEAEELGITPFQEERDEGEGSLVQGEGDMEIQVTPGCGQVCTGFDDKCLYPCHCKTDGGYCVGPNACFTVYKCKG